MLCGWEGNRTAGLAEWTTSLSHLRDDCLYTDATARAPELLPSALHVLLPTGCQTNEVKPTVEISDVSALVRPAYKLRSAWTRRNRRLTFDDVEQVMITPSSRSLIDCWGVKRLSAANYSSSCIPVAEGRRHEMTGQPAVRCVRVFVEWSVGAYVAERLSTSDTRTFCTGEWMR